jgi:hypothetical protein
MQNKVEVFIHGLSTNLKKISKLIEPFEGLMSIVLAFISIVLASVAITFAYNENVRSHNLYQKQLLFGRPFLTSGKQFSLKHHSAGMSSTYSGEHKITNHGTRLASSVKSGIIMFVDGMNNNYLIAFSNKWGVSTIPLPPFRDVIQPIEVELPIPDPENYERHIVFIFKGYDPFVDSIFINVEVYSIPAGKGLKPVSSLPNILDSVKLWSNDYIEKSGDSGHPIEMAEIVANWDFELQRVIMDKE